MGCLTVGHTAMVTVQEAHQPDTGILCCGHDLVGRQCMHSFTTAYSLCFSGTARCLAGERLLQVVDQIVRVFDAHRVAHEPLRDAHRRALRRR